MLTGKALGNAIREAIRRKGVTQVDVAAHFGVKPPSVQDWLNRGVIAKEKLPELWSYFSDVCTPEHWGLSISGGGTVPVISWEQAVEFTDGIAWETSEYVNTWAPVQRYTFALHVLDDRMEPAFPQGSIIVVEPELAAKPNDYVIVRGTGAERAEATCKQLVRDGDDLYLKPRNDRYPIKPLGGAKIVGVVVEMTQKFR